MNELTLEVAKEMLKLIANFHAREVACENCYVEGCREANLRIPRDDEFLEYWQSLAEKAIREGL